MIRRLTCLCLPILFVVCSCDNGGGKCGVTGGGPVSERSVIGPKIGGSPDPDGGAPVNLTISGNVSYDRLSVTAGGLDLMNPVSENAVGVTVEAVAWSDINNVLATANTDAVGAYTLNFSTTVDYYIRARARSGVALNVDRVYHSQTSPPLVHAVTGQVLNRAAGSQTVNLHAAADSANRAGAFAILDTARRLRTAAAGAFANLGPLDLFWGMGNAGTQWLKDGGGQTITLTTGTGLDGPRNNPSIYLVGGSAADVLNSDHDEFDESVIAHEWASFLQLTQSRDNNFGGVHFGEELIPSAAYSEGVVTGIGLALLDQRVYRDTVGYVGGVSSVAFQFDLESGVLPGTGSGYGNEFAISRVTWDLLDGGAGGPTDADSDPVGVATADFLASFAALSTRAGPYEIAWMASLLQQLIDDTFLNQSDANTLMGTYSAAFPPAGGDSFPALLTVGAGPTAGSLDAWSGPDPNPILGPQANGLWRIELASPQSVTIDVINTTGGYSAGANRLDLSVHDLSRQIVAQDAGDASDKSVTVSLSAGTYIVRIQHRPDSQGSSAATGFTVQAQ